MTHSVGIPMTVMNLIILCFVLQLTTYEREISFEKSTRRLDMERAPVEASMINKRAVISEKRTTEVPRTVRVGQRLIKGAMRMAPTH